MPGLADALQALNNKNGFVADTTALEQLLETLAALPNQAQSDSPTPKTVNDHLNFASLLGGTVGDKFDLNATDVKALRDAAFHHLVRLRVSKLDLEKDSHKIIIRAYLALDRDNDVAFQNFVTAHGEALSLSASVLAAAKTNVLLTANRDMRNQLYNSYTNQLREQLIITSDAQTAAQLSSSSFTSDDTLEQNRTAFSAKLKPILQKRLGYSTETEVDDHVNAMTSGDLAAMRNIRATAVLRASQLVVVKLASNPPNKASKTLLQSLVNAENSEVIRTALKTALADDTIKALLDQQQADKLLRSLELGRSTVTESSRKQLHSQAVKLYFENLFEYEPPRGLDTTDANVLEALKRFNHLVETAQSNDTSARAAVIRQVLTTSHQPDNSLTGDQKRNLLNLDTGVDINFEGVSDEDCVMFYERCRQLQTKVNDQLSFVEQQSFSAAFDVLVPPAAVVTLTEQVPLTKDAIIAYLRGKTDNFTTGEWTATDDGGCFKARGANFEVPAIEQGTNKQQLYNQLGSLLLRLQTTIKKDSVNDVTQLFVAEGGAEHPDPAANLRDCHQTAKYAAGITGELVNQLQQKLTELKAAESAQQPLLIAKYQLALESLQSRQTSLQRMAAYYRQKETLFKLRNGVNDGTAARAPTEQEIEHLNKLQQGASLAYAEVQRITEHDWQQHFSNAHMQGDRINITLNNVKMVASKEQLMKLPQCLDTTTYSPPQLMEKEGIVSFELGLKDAKDPAKVEYKTAQEHTAEVSISGTSGRVVEAFVALYQARLVTAGVLKKQDDGTVSVNSEATDRQKQEAAFQLVREEIVLTKEGGQPLANDRQEAFYQELDSVFKEKFGDYYRATAPEAASPKAVFGGKRHEWQQRPRSSVTTPSTTTTAGTFAPPSAGGDPNQEAVTPPLGNFGAT